MKQWNTLIWSLLRYFGVFKDDSTDYFLNVATIVIFSADFKRIKIIIKISQSFDCNWRVETHFTCNRTTFETELKLFFCFYYIQDLLVIFSGSTKIFHNVCSKVVVDFFNFSFEILLQVIYSATLWNIFFLVHHLDSLTLILLELRK